MSFVLTKTNYKIGVRCKKYLWLKKNKKELMKEPSLSEKANIDEGILIGEIARDHPLFQGGVLLESKDKKMALINTLQAMDDENIKVLYEAAFSYQSQTPSYIEVDILEKNDDGSVNLIEVKSSSRTTKEHLTDIAFQKWVLRKLGYKVNKSYLMKVNKEYVYDGLELDLGEYFILEEVSEQIKKIYSKITRKSKTLQKVIDSEKEPTRQIGSHCKNPYNCPFKDTCYKNVTKDNIEKLTRISKKKRKELRGLGIKKMQDIPLTFDLTSRQKIQRKVSLNKNPHYNHERLKDHLSLLKFPLYFLDFECYNRSIPPYKGAKPNQFNTFQASLHIMQKNGKIEHKEFLFEDLADPSIKIADWMIENLNDKGSVVVFNESFERTRIKEIFVKYPEYKESLSKIIGRIWDLEVPFKNSWYYIHDFEGSSSIKYVLPALVPELSYKDLLIQDGSTAQSVYWNLINKQYHEKINGSLVKGTTYQKYKNALLEYCKLDTWAMVKILEFLRNKVELFEQQEIA